MLVTQTQFAFYVSSESLPESVATIVGSNSHRYSLYDSKYTWSQAKEICERLGGYLVTVTGAEEQELVATLAEKGTLAKYWLGATDEVSEGNWKWVTGEAFSYSKWSSGQPDNSNNEDGLVLWTTKYVKESLLGWNDCPMNSTDGGFICEFESEYAGIEPQGGSLSDWVLASEVPADAEIVDRKYTYTQRSYFSSAYSSKSYWTWYERKRTDWGPEQGPVYSNPQNGERNVREEEYVSGYGTKHTWHFHKWGKYPLDYSYSYNAGGMTEYHVYTNYNPTNANQRPVAKSGSTYRWHANGDSSWAAVYFVNEYDETDYNKPIKSIRWYYQEPVYTHYYYRDDKMESKTNPTGGSGVSNVKEMVRYKLSFNLIFDSNGGECNPQSKTVTFDKAYGELPTPVKDGYIFLGWYTEKSGGKRIYAEDIFKETTDKTIYACWIDEALVKCGDNLAWSLNNNKLTISGTGEMYNYAKGESPFSKLAGYINQVQIEDGVESIGDYAFYGCALFEMLKLPATVSTVGKDAIGGCNNLKEMFVLNHRCTFSYEWTKAESIELAIYGYQGSPAEKFASDFNKTFVVAGAYGKGENYEWLFNGDNKTLDLTGEGKLPDFEADNLPWNDFKGDIVKVNFSDKITYIGNNALSGCINVEKIDFSSGLNNVGINVFEDTKWFKSLENGAVMINTTLYAYKESAENNDIILNSGITGISANFSRSFKDGGKSPQSIQISNTVSRIDEGALGYASELTQLTVHSGNSNYKTINNVLYSKDGKTLICYPAGLGADVTIPNTVTKIGDYAFAGASKIEKITISSNIKSIGKHAFDGTNLTTICGYYGSYANQYADENGYNFIPFTSTVAFDYNCEDLENTEKIVNTGTAIGDLYVPGREGFEFIGWYLETDTEDIKITKDFVVNEDIKVYAYWEEIPVEVPYISGIEIVSVPEKLDYFVGDKISTKGLKVTANYSDGTKETVENGFLCVPAKLTSPGLQKVTVLYAGYSSEFNVTATAVVPVSLSLISIPKTLTYFISTDEYAESSFSAKGLVALVEYNNGTSQLIRDTTKLEYVYDFSTPDIQSNVIVNYYENDAVVSAFYQVKVLEKPKLYSQNVSAISGDEIAVPVYISNNVGLMGLKIGLSYDSDVLEPVGISKVINTGELKWNNGYNEDGNIELLWTDTQQFKTDCLLFNVYFKVNNNAETQSTDVIFTTFPSDTYNENYESVYLDTENLLINVTKSEKPILYSDDINSESGEYIYVPIKCKNNIGFSDMSLITLTYDPSVFEYIEVTENSANVFKTSSINGKVKVTIEEFGKDKSEDVLFTVKLKIKEKISGNYKLTIETNELDWNCENAHVDITKKVKKPKVYSDEVEASVGDSIKIPVKISGNSGLMGYKIFLSYDTYSISTSRLVNNTIWNGIFDYNISNGLITVVWNGKQNIDANGTLFEIEGKVLENTLIGTEIIEVSYSEVDTYDDSWTDVALDCSDIKINVDNPISKVSISKMPDKTEYFVGDTLDTSGLTLKVEYSTGDYKLITSGYDCTPVKLDNAGNQKIIVNYRDKTTNFDVNVIEVENRADFLIGNASGKAGSTVALQFAIQNSPKLKSFSITNLKFDTTKLSYEKAECNVENVAISNVLANGNAVVAFNDNQDINGVVFTYYFKIKDNIDDCTIPVSCEFSAKEKPVGESEQSVVFEVKSGEIVVKNFVAGDFNGDDVVDSDDAIYLLWYTYLPNEYSINQPADFNSDGSVDSDDAIYLLWHTYLPENYPLS